MASFHTRVFRGDGMTRQTKEALVEGLLAALPVELDGAPDKGAARYVYQQVRDEHRFKRRWVSDYRAEMVRARRRVDFFTHWMPGMEAV